MDRIPKDWDLIDREDALYKGDGLLTVGLRD